MCVRAEEVLGVARPKKANKSKGKKKAKQTQKQQADILWLSLSEIGIGIGIELGKGKGIRFRSSVLGGFVFVSLCLAVKCFDAYGLSNAGDTNRQKLPLTRLSHFRLSHSRLSLSLILCHFLFVCTPPIKIILQCFLFMVRQGSSSEIYVSIVSGTYDEFICILIQ